MSQEIVVVSDRHSGLDLLRIVAMLMVCIIHMNLFTRSNCDIIQNKEYVYYFANWIQSVGIVGVNIYALITGYVCIHCKWMFSRYAKLWVLVAFYMLMLAIVGYVMSALELVDVPVLLHEMVVWLKLLLFGSSYWYFAAYSGLFFLIPFLNSALRKISKEKYMVLVLSMLIFFPLLNLSSNQAILGTGYNLIWLSFLYVVGAYIRLYPPVRYSSSVLLLVSFFCSILVFVAIRLSICNAVFFFYAKPHVMLNSVVLFIIFTRLKIRSIRCQRLISWLAPASFSVYLIQCHPWVWKTFVAKMPKLYSAIDNPWWFSVVFGVALYIVASIIDFVRIALFRLCRVNTVSDWVAGGIERMVKKLMPKLKRMLE